MGLMSFSQVPTPLRGTRRSLIFSIQSSDKQTATLR